MICSECRELLAAYCERALDAHAGEAVELHLRDCAACRAEMNAFAELHEKLLRDGQVLRETSLSASVLDRISRERRRPEGRSSVVIRFMRTGAGKASALAASLAIVIAALLIVLWDRSSGTAYALDALQKTVEANRSVRSIHIKIEGMADTSESSDTWAQFDETGKLERLRTEKREEEGGDFVRIAVWQNDKATVWVQKHKIALVVKAMAQLKKLLEENFFDPKAAVEKLHADAAEGKAQIETDEPSKEGEPLKLVVTRTESPDMREEYLIAPDTNLLKEIDTFKIVADVPEPQKRLFFLDYNKPIDPSVFELKLPKDVAVIDQTTQAVGMEKGNLKDEEIAAKVASEFFEALVADDWAKAGRLFQGIPGERLKEIFQKSGMGDARFRRVVSIGKPHPPLTPKFKASPNTLVVPCDIEFELKGTKVVQSMGVIVTPVQDQPGRWSVGGMTGPNS